MKDAKTALSPKEGSRTWMEGERVERNETRERSTVILAAEIERETMRMVGW